MRELCDVKPKFVIDTSTPEALERDFYAWLKGDLHEVTETKIATSSSTLSASFGRSSSTTLPPIEQLCFGTKCVTISSNDDLLSNGASPAPSSSSCSGSPQSCQFEAAQAPSHSHSAQYSNIVYAVQHYHLHTNININSSSAIITSAQKHHQQQQQQHHHQQQHQEPPSSYQDQGVAPLLRPIKKEQPDLTPVGSKIEFPPMATPVFPSTSVLVTVPPPSTTTTAAAKNSATGTGRSSGTNQLGRTYSPGLPLSMIDREQIVAFYQAGWKICDISKKLCVTHSCVSKILNRFRTTGSVRPKDAKEGRMESPLVAAIRDYRYRLGMTRQSQIREQLIADGICRRENAPSRSSINHILRTKLDVKKRKK